MCCSNRKAPKQMLSVKNRPGISATELYILGGSEMTFLLSRLPWSSYVVHLL